MSNMTSRVYLYQGIPFSLNGTDTRYFATKLAQDAYFSAKQVHAEKDLTYIRPDTQTLRVDKKYGQVVNCNYLSFINVGNDDTLYYAFITKVEYLNEDATILHFEIDPVQTYMRTMNITGFVEREHANYNELNTLPEEVGLGDYTTVQTTDLRATTTPRFAIITATTDFSNPVGYSGGTSTLDPKGISQPYNYYIINASSDEMTLGDNIAFVQNLMGFSQFYAESEDLANKVVNIQVVDTLPFPHTLTKVELGSNQYKWEIRSVHLTKEDMSLMNYALRVSNHVPFTKTYTVNKHGGTKYTQDASKLNHFPYTKIEMVNGEKKVEFKPELFATDTITIEEIRTLEIDAQMSFRTLYANEPKHLNMMTYNAGVKIPVVSESLSAYIQSRDNASVSSWGGAVGIGGAMIGLSALTGGLAGVMGTTATIGSTIFNEYQQMKKMDRQPNNVQGSNDKLLKLHLDIQSQVLVKKQTPEYITMISNFFKAYGWKCLKHKSPNINTRTSFNYVKMTDAIVKGVIPQEHVETIKSRLLEGITFWHTDDIGNYALTNTIK